MSQNEKKTKSASQDLTVLSIGVALALPEEKGQKPCIVIAYMTDTGDRTKAISYVMLDWSPKQKPHTRDSLLEAVRAAEKVKHISYRDFCGGPKDLYLCRPAAGKITDIVERDYDRDAYADGFAEICECNLRFVIDTTGEIRRKTKKRLQFRIISSIEQAYQPGSYGYAIVNAYNACLLGNLFEKEVLRLVTHENTRVKLEVREHHSAFVDNSILYIHPVFHDGSRLVDHYMTEAFELIDGESRPAFAYKLIYNDRFSDYLPLRM